MRADHFVEGALIPDLHRLLYGRVLDNEEAPLLRIRAIGRALPRFEDTIDERIGYRVGLEAPHCARRVDDLKKLSTLDHKVPLLSDENWTSCLADGVSRCSKIRAHTKSFIAACVRTPPAQWRGDRQCTIICGTIYACAITKSPTRQARAIECQNTKRRIDPSWPNQFVAVEATTIDWASIILPITPPDELAAAINTGERPSCSEVIFCRLPKRTLEAVSDPVSATPSHPSKVP